MRRIFLIIIVLIISTVLSACMGGVVKPNFSGFVFEAEEDKVIIAYNMTEAEFNEIKHKSIEEFGDPTAYPLISLTYDDAKQFTVGDEVNIWMEGDVADTYPQRGGANKIALVE